MTGEQQGSPPSTPPSGKRKKHKRGEFIPEVRWHVATIFFVVGDANTYVMQEVAAETLLREFCEGDGEPIHFEHTMGFSAISPECVTRIDVTEMKGQA